MSDSVTPKPGPTSTPSTHYPPYRELAKQHATAANVILSDQGPDVADPERDDYLAAIAHALTAIAFTEMAPPARYRPRADHPRPKSRPPADSSWTATEPVGGRR